MHESALPWDLAMHLPCRKLIREKHKISTKAKNIQVVRKTKIACSIWKMSSKLPLNSIFVMFLC